MPGSLLREIINSTITLANGLSYGQIQKEVKTISIFFEAGPLTSKKT
ncbi:MAG: hypothetical protein KGI10_01235 [Thaumarchaeota archaeon]|nr:hypothetical protein [Nitrososphaerota archaeon]